MTWYQIKLQVKANSIETVTQFLNLLGADAVTYADAADQPILEPDLNTTPLWDDTWIIGLFSNEKIDLQQAYQFIVKQLPSDTILNHQIETLADQPWERAWLDHFQAMQFGKRLWICPSTQTPPDSNGVNIILDPGLAFGTGTHPTTALCLEWLDAHPPQNLRVIDYGCGSGILAIAAAKLGASEVWAVDHDPQALEATHANAERNQVADRLHIVAPEELNIFQADVLLANILAQPLCALAERFKQLLIPGGKIVLAGILNDQAEQVKKHYAPHIEFNASAIRENWVCIAGEKIN